MVTVVVFEFSGSALPAPEAGVSLQSDTKKQSVTV